MKKYFFLLIIAAITISCEKFPASEVSFDVKTDSANYKVNDKVVFKFNGDANQISFYSGKVGNEYSYKDVKRIDSLKELNFSFQTHNTQTEAGVVVTVLISTDFNGVYDYENVTKATWTDVTSKYTFGPFGVFSGTSPAWTASTVQNILSFTKPGKPYYIAFKYYAPAYPTGTVPSRNWRTQLSVLNGVTTFGTTQALATFTGMGWKQVKKNPLAVTSSTVSSSIMLFAYPAAASVYNRLEYEEWGISKAFQADKIDLGLDFGVPIKQYVDPQLTEYSTTYTSPGVYKATFVASNTTKDNDSKVVREVVITVK